MFNNLEEWQTYSEEQVVELLNQNGYSIIHKIVTHLDTRRGYLSVADEIREMFKYTLPVIKKEPPKGGSILSLVKK